MSLKLIFKKIASIFSRKGDIAFNPGGIPDTYDHRDYQWSELGFGTAPFDWAKGFDIEEVLKKALNDDSFSLPTKDQNGSGSCGGQAWAYYAQILEAIVTGSFEERSAKYIYAQTNAPGGGSAGRPNCEIFVNQGVAYETKCLSYENGLPPSEAFMIRAQDITQEARDNAALSKSLAYSNVRNNIDDVAQAIEANNGVIIGVRGQNNGTWYTEFPKKPTSLDWGHWVYAGKAKRINGVKHIGFKNSWGDAAGVKGWQWLSEDWFGDSIGWNPIIFSIWTNSSNPDWSNEDFNHTFNTNLRLGDKGDEVVALQKGLRKLDCFPKNVKATGYFGNVTKNSVATFQTKYNITPAAGYCGPITRKKLNSLLGKK